MSTCVSPNKIFSRFRGKGRLTVDRSLTRQLLKHLGSTSKSVTRLTNTDVQHQLLDAQLAHGVRALVLSVRLHCELEFIHGRNSRIFLVWLELTMVTPWALNWSTRSLENTRKKERVVKSKCSVWAGRGKREALSVLALFGANRRAASDPDFGWPQQRTTA